MNMQLTSPTWTIENAATTEVFGAIISRIQLSERPAWGKPKFRFNWRQELNEPGRRVFKLVTASNPRIIHGLLSLSPQQGGVNMHLIESSHLNRGPEKVYLRVAGNLIAYACRLSYELGHEGYVFFTAKSHLIEHYRQAYGATQIRQQLMAIEPAAALRLLDQYHNGYLTNPA